MTAEEIARVEAALEQVYEVACAQIDENHAALEKYRTWYREERQRANKALRGYIMSGVVHLMLCAYWLYLITTLPVCK